MKLQSIRPVRYLSKILICLALISLWTGTVSVGAAIADDDQPPPAADPSKAVPEKKEEKPETIKTGVIASSTKTGSFAAIDVETSGAAPGDEASVISASVLRPKRDVCIAKVMNNGTKPYSVNFAVEGVNQRGAKTLNTSYSATIPPKGSIERQIPRCDSDLNIGINLRSAKALK